MYKLIICSAAVLAVAFAGCATVEVVDSQAATRAFERGKKLYQDGDFQAARLAFQTYRAGQTEPERIAEGCYWEGMSLLAQREFVSSTEKFRSALEKEPKGWLGTYTLCALGESLMGQGDYDAASESYAKALEGSQMDVRLDHVLLRLATCAQRTNKWEEADGFLKRLLTETPRSPLAGQAKEKLQYGKGRFFTVQVGAFKTLEAANQRASQLKEQGLHPFVNQVERGGEELHCVCVGRFENWEKANLETQRIRGQGRIENAIVKP